MREEIHGVDLDLVELRCKVRGWSCERVWADAESGQSEWAYALEITTPEGYLAIRDDGACEGALAYAQSLTAPRWTIDRLLQHPPDGWACIEQPPEPRPKVWYAIFVWGTMRFSRGDDVWEVQVHLSPSMAVTPSIDRASDHARLVERLKALSELTAIIGEIVP